MSEHENEPTAPIDLSDAGGAPAQDSVAAEEDIVEGEPGWESRDDAS